MAIAGIKQRLFTAIFFVIVVVGMITAGKYFTYALLLVIGLGTAFEYEKAVHGRYLGLYGGLVIIFFALIYFLIPPDQHSFLLPASCMVALLLIYWVFKTPYKLNHQKYGSMLSIFYIGIPLGILSQNMLYLPEYKPFLFGVLLLIWASDTGAYLVGSQIGKTKLLPRVSPKKTVEGFLGALVVTLLAALVMDYMTDIRSIYWWLASAMIVWLFGSLGDLVQSSIKRRYGIKDSGTLLPGHGGFWDRFDSFIMVIPFILLLDNYYL